MLRRIPIGRWRERGCAIIARQDRSNGVPETEPPRLMEDSAGWTARAAVTVRGFAGEPDCGIDPVDVQKTKLKQRHRKGTTWGNGTL